MGKKKEPIDFLQLITDDLNTAAELQELFPGWKRKSILKKIKETSDGKDLRFIAKKNSKIIAHVRYVQGKGLHKHRTETLSLIVTKEERGKGIAEALLKYSLRRMPKEIKLVILAVAKENKPALSLYKKLGFEKYGFLKRASIVNGKFVDNYLLKKEL